VFEQGSRYAGIETVQTSLPDGRVVTAVRRRVLPHAATMDELVRVVVEQADVGRVDLLATRTLGDSEQYWRLCDANDVVHPDELTEELGRTVRVAGPRIGPGGAR
jgi:hypothetical protein